MRGPRLPGSIGALVLGLMSLALSSTSHVIFDSGKLERNSMSAGRTWTTSPMALRRIINIFSGFLVISIPIVIILQIFSHEWKCLLKLIQYKSFLT